MHNLSPILRGSWNKHSITYCITIILYNLILKLGQFDFGISDHNSELNVCKFTDFPKILK